LYSGQRPIRPLTEAGGFPLDLPASQAHDGHDGEEYPLLILQSSPEAIEAMLDDIRSELGTEVISFLRQCGALGRVVAVLLECKVAGHTPNLMEACSLANVEREVSALMRDTHPMAFDIEDLDRILSHAAPALHPLSNRIFGGERNRKDMFRAH
jgi:hypothetical protein